MAWHMTSVLVLGTLVLIIAQNHPFIAASSRWTLDKQQLHHDGRAVGRNQLPLGIALMVGEIKQRGNLQPPSPKDSPGTSPSPKDSPASSRWTLEKQQLHHDGRAVGSDQLPLGIALMVGEIKQRGNLTPPSPRRSPDTSPHQ
ncbi:hypothetical protein AAC387_Pa09g1756 [Persea americana]